MIEPSLIILLFYIIYIIIFIAEIYLLHKILEVLIEKIKGKKPISEMMGEITVTFSLIGVIMIFSASWVYKEYALLALVAAFLNPFMLKYIIKEYKE